MTEKICYVTSYFDIGRDDWIHFNRKFEQYFNSFKNFSAMFKSLQPHSPYELIVFIDDKHHHKLKEYIGDSPCITLIPTNENFLETKIDAWSRLEREAEIMNSEQFKNIVKNRLYCPETSIPKYTCITHAKIDFVNLAKSLSNADYFCWVDFAYCGSIDNVPKNFLDINKLDRTKINYVLLNNLDQHDYNMTHTLIYSPEKVLGGFFFGSREKIEEYQELYHTTHKYFQENNIVDDDQHIPLQASLIKPDLFKFECLFGWFEALKHYQINS